MSPELEEKLYEDFPELFAQKDKPMNQTCMCWGCECGDGWEPLIRKTCEALVATGDDVQFTQVKEKFGGLRLYVNNYTDAVSKIVDKAGEESETICEDCSKPGTHRTDGWWRTTCDACEVLRLQKRLEDANLRIETLSRKAYPLAERERESQ